MGADMGTMEVERDFFLRKLIGWRLGSEKLGGWGGGDREELFQFIFSKLGYGRISPSFRFFPFLLSLHGVTSDSATGC